MGSHRNTSILVGFRIRGAFEGHLYISATLPLERRVTTFLLGTLWLKGTGLVNVVKHPPKFTALDYIGIIVQLQWDGLARLVTPITWTLIVGFRYSVWEYTMLICSSVLASKGRIGKQNILNVII